MVYRSSQSPASPLVRIPGRHSNRRPAAMREILQKHRRGRTMPLDPSASGSASLSSISPSLTRVPFCSIPISRFVFVPLPLLPNHIRLSFSFSLFLLLSRYNGQTHNKEGKRGTRTRYVGRLTMEHTWARAGAFEMALGRRRKRERENGKGKERERESRYRTMHRYEMWWDEKRGTVRSEGRGTMLSTSSSPSSTTTTTITTSCRRRRRLLRLLRGGAPFSPASPRRRGRVPARCSPICSRNTEHRQSPRTHVVVAQLGIVRHAPPSTNRACVRHVSLSTAPA